MPEVIHREHALAADCWCGPRVEVVSGGKPNPGTKKDKRLARNRPSKGAKK